MRTLASFCLLILLAPGAYGGEVPPARRAELLHLLRHDCGSCHGMQLAGGLGPPLTSTALAGKPRELLFHAIIDGRPGTPMPPWRGILSADEASWLVDILFKGVPIAD
jgi:cytochrome c55X